MKKKCVLAQQCASIFLVLGTIILPEVTSADTRLSNNSLELVAQKIKNYKADFNDILEHSAVKKNMKLVMGNKYPLFFQTIGLYEIYPERHEDEIFTSGCPRHMCTITEGAISVNLKTANVQVLLLNDDLINLWGANDEKDLSPEMKNFLEDLKLRRSKSANKLTIVFQKRDQANISHGESKKKHSK